MFTCFFRLSTILALAFVLGGCQPREGEQDEAAAPGDTAVPAETVTAAAPATPAEGHSVHVVAPHMVEGMEMGPFHHYCKVISPEPIIECLIYESTDPGAPMTQVEYIAAKSITRQTIPLREWNERWHDHEIEIASGRVQVLDLPPDQAQEVADLVATTDGLIFHLWHPVGSQIPTGRVTIAQAVGHRPMSEEEFRAPLAGSSP